MNANAIKFTLVGSVLLLIAAAAKKELTRVPVSDIGENTIILGDLRRPIGESVTIHGYKFTNGPFPNCFRVDALNGESFAPSTYVHITGIEKWPEKAEATLRGYEVGTIRHEDDANYGPDDPRFKSQQTIFLRFEVLEVLDPKKLKLESR